LASQNYKAPQRFPSALSDSSRHHNSGFNLFRPPPGFLALYALFSPIIIRAVPAAVRPGHGRKSSSCRYSHPHGLSDKILSKRKEVYEAAKAEHPERWNGRATRDWSLPDTVYLNPDKVHEQSEEADDQMAVS